MTKKQKNCIHVWVFGSGYGGTDHHGPTPCMYCGLLFRDRGSQ